MTASSDHDEPEEEWEGASAPNDLDSLPPVTIGPFVSKRLSDEEEDERLRQDLERSEAEDAFYEQERIQAEAEAEVWDSEPSWGSVGETLKRARVRLGLSKREAAKRANLSDGAWRHLEAGVKFINGAVVYPNPRDENLVAAAQAVKVPPAVVFQLAARPLPKELVEAPTPDRMLESLMKLRASDRELVTGLIERLLR